MSRNSRNNLAKITAAVEGLESRNLFSSVTLTDGLLTLRGDADKSNVLRVEYSGGTNVFAIANGKTQTFPKASITGVHVDGGEKGDRISVSYRLKVPARVTGNGGNDVIYGGAGNDTIYGGTGEDRINGRAGRDTVFGGAGTDVLQGTKGVDMLVQGDDAPVPTPPPPPPVGEVPANAILVTDYGVKADGQSDDADAIQRAVTAAPDGATILFPAGTYKVGHTIVVGKNITIDGNGATLLFDNAGKARNPWWDKHFTVQSKLDTQRFTWREPIRQGETTFNVSVPQTTLRQGDTVYLELGQDPYDPYTQNFNTLATVVANTGSSITLDRPVPYDINQGTMDHRITKVTTVTENVTIKNFNLDYTNGSVADMNISVEFSRNVHIENITGRFTNFVNVADSQDVTVENVTGSLEVTHVRGGRALTVWQSDRTRMTNVNVTTTQDAPVVFLESWARDTTIDGLDVTWKFTGVPTSNVLHFTGGSYGTFVDNLVVRNTAPILLVGSGAATKVSDYAFGAVEITGPIKAAPADLMRQLTVGGRRYSTVQTMVKQIALRPNAAITEPLLDGAIIRRITVQISSKSGVRNIFLLNTADLGLDILPQLVAGQAVDLAQSGSVGSLYPFNDLGGSAKRFGIVTGAGVPSGATMTVTIEYLK